jgi:hypothetical protein
LSFTAGLVAAAFEADPEAPPAESEDPPHAATATAATTTLRTASTRDRHSSDRLVIGFLSQTGSNTGLSMGFSQYDGDRIAD